MHITLIYTQYGWKQLSFDIHLIHIPGLVRISSLIFCLGGKNSFESLTTPSFVGTLYWHVINLFCTTLGY